MFTSLAVADLPLCPDTALDTGAELARDEEIVAEQRLIGMDTRGTATHRVVALRIRGRGEAKVSSPARRGQ
jgi:hypothetical protein